MAEAMIRGVFLWCVALIIGAEEEWTVSRVLQAVEAREQALVNLDAILEVWGAFPEGYEKYRQRRYESARLMAEAAGMTLPPLLPAQGAPAAASARNQLRYRRGRSGLERVDLIDTETSSSAYAFDGQSWWTLRGDWATRTDSGQLPHDGVYLGLDLNWLGFLQRRVGLRSLARDLAEFHAQGFVELPREKTVAQTEMIVLVVRQPASQPLPEDVLNESVLVFNPRLGMALMQHKYQLVRKVGDEFLQVVTQRIETRWYDFQEVGPGLWLPREYWVGYYDDVLFPKTGTRYPKGFDPSKAYPRDFRVETHLTYEGRARVTSIRIGEELGPDTFKLNPPKDAIVYDTINDRLYQTREFVPMTLEDDLRQSLASRRTDYGVWLWIVAANLAVFAGLGAWLWLRRMRAGRHGSAARPSS